jgi:hypothetical protein
VPRVAADPGARALAPPPHADLRLPRRRPQRRRRRAVLHRRSRRHARGSPRCARDRARRGARRIHGWHDGAADRAAASGSRGAPDARGHVRAPRCQAPDAARALARARAPRRSARSAGARPAALDRAGRDDRADRSDRADDRVLQPRWCAAHPGAVRAPVRRLSRARHARPAARDPLPDARDVRPQRRAHARQVPPASSPTRSPTRGS